MSRLKETVFIGRDNPIRLVLKEDGDLLNIAYPSLSPTRWVFEVGDSLVFDSDTDDLFTWDLEASTLEINIGPTLTAENVVSSAPCELVMYSSEFDDGVVLVHKTCNRNRLLVTICD